MSNDPELLRAVAAVIRANDQVHAAVDRYYADRDVDADAEDVARALVEAAISLDERP